MRIALVQPRHIYAPTDTPLGQIYMPTSLLSVGARLLAAGLSVEFNDENIRPAELRACVVGINAIGAPYVGRVRELLDRSRKEAPGGVRIVGGQGVRGFSKAHFKHLFGEATIDGNDSSELARGLSCESIPGKEGTSLVPAYGRLPKEDFERYLRSEFCFYLSQGCKYSCTFCAAERSYGAARHRVTETYREPGVVADDLLFLCRSAAAMSIPRLLIYLSNLDLFQSPRLLDQFADAAIAARKASPGVELRIRALSTVQSFLLCHDKSKSTIRKMLDAGLERVGFGIDGATPLVWRATKKPQNADKCVRAIMVANQSYGLIPETLMVFGHNESDTAASLDAAVQFVDESRNKFAAVPRPHVAKEVIPGNDGWVSKAGASTVNYLMQRPEAFQLLDFTTLPSWLTHPDPDLRQHIARAFLSICHLGTSLTQYTMPEDPESTEEDLGRAKVFNQGRYDI